MKIRTGFVTNSSSSSFCIIGTGDIDSIKGIYAKIFECNCNEYEDEGIWPNWNPSHGCQIATGHDSFNFWGTYDEPYPYYFGHDAEDLLRSMTIGQACDWFVDECKERFNIDVPRHKVKFYFGEMG